MKPHFLFIAVLVIGVAIAVGSYIANRAVEITPAPQPPPSSVVCAPQWSCSEWSSCLNGREFRSCADEKQCGTLKEKPEISRSCVVSAVCGNAVCEAGETYKTCSTDCGIYKPNCAESWSCTTWSSCLGGSQTRTCKDKNVCGTAANRPAQLQACTASATCTENWFCSNWSQCGGGVQNRICTDLDSCTTTVNKPPISQSCTASCTENWSCSAWGSCVNGTESRTCSDLNGCGTALNKPPQSQNCSTGPPNIPNAPSNLSLSNIQSDRITLGWSDNSNVEDGFMVERKVGTSQSAQFFDFVQLSSDSIAYNDLSVGPDQTYTYRVRAFNTVGSSAYSNTASATTPPLPPPPTEDTAALCSDGVDNDGDGLIDLADPDCAPFAPPPLPTVTVSATDSNATEGTPPSDTGTYTITRSGGDQTQSLVVSFTMDSASTATPLDYTLSSNNSVMILADQSSATITLTPADDTAVEPQEDAILQLSSNPSAYTLGSPSSATVHIADNDAPAVPTVSVAATDANAAETSGLPLNTGTFRITRSVSSSSPLPVNITILIASTATAGSDYQTITSPQTIPGGATFIDVTVTPIDDTEVEQSETVILDLVTGSGYNVGGSSSATVTIADNDAPLNPPAAPSNLTTTVFNTGTLTTTGRITLDWQDNANNEDSFKIERSLDNVNFSLRATIPADSRAWNDLTVFGNKHYYYRVKASNTAGDSNPSNVDVATTIMAPSNLAATQVTSTQAALAWTDNATIETAYIVERSTTSDTTGFTAFPALSPNTTTFTNTNLTPNTSYWYRVKARNTVGDSPYSNVIQVITNVNLSTITVSSPDSSATEGTPPMDTGTFTITRTGGDQSVALTVAFTMDPASTASQSDYTLSPNGSVTILANQSSATVTLIPADDMIVEPPPPETAILNLSSNASVYTLGSPSSATVAITDNDPPPPIDTTPPDITTFTLTPGNGQVVVAYSGSDPGPPSTPPVHYIVIRGTSQSAVDAVPVANFANPGSGIVVVVPDTTQSGSTTDAPLTNGTMYWYRLRVCDSVSPNPNCAANQAQSATPTAPPSTPTVSVAATDPDAAELNQDIGTFTVTRSGGNQSQPLDVFFVMRGGTVPATENIDYTVSPSGTATILANQSSATITLIPIDDTISEPTETAILRLSTDAGYTISVTQGSAIVSITDSDTITISVGSASVVFDYPTNTCSTAPDHWDAADANVHAIKNAQGELVLESGNAPDNYFMYSSTPSFDDLQRDCSKPVLVSANTDDTTGLLFPAETFNHQQWITSIYRVGQTIYAFVHNEYHDAHVTSGPPPNGNGPCKPGRVFSDNPCWYNSINLAVSATDGGHSFRQNVTNANHVMAFPNLTWNPSSNGGSAPVYGYMSPSNIMKKSDGYYYMMFFAITHPSGQSRGSCLARTTDLSNAQSWRAWDGSAFTIAMTNPYTSTPQTCAFVSPNQIGDLHESVTFNTYLNKYFVVGTSQGAQGCGFYFSTSDDLIAWAPKQLLRTAPLAWCGGSFQNGQAYPSIIDHAQLNNPNDPNDFNFERSGNQPYLYYLYMHDNPGFNRDLMRQQITICQAGKPAAGCP